MYYKIEGGSLPALVIQLKDGEGVISESGGRTWSRGPIKTETTSNGGVKKVMGRMFSGESLFMSRYTAQGDAEIAFTSSFPGRIIARELAAGESIFARRQRSFADAEIWTFLFIFKKRSARDCSVARALSCKR